MRQQQRTKQFPGGHPFMKAIKGLQNEMETVAGMVETGWNFAHTALWNNAVFSEREKQEARTRIMEFIINAKAPQKGYLAFVQRVLLARQYLSNNPGKYIPLPSTWLNEENANGFAGTKEWYSNLLSVRASLPNHKSELRAFAEAILEMTDEPTAANFHFWRNYFIDNKCPGLLSLFLSTIANQQYGL